MTTITAPNTPLIWPADGDITVTAAVFLLAGEPPEASTADYAGIVRDELIAEAKRARGRSPVSDDRSALMQKLDKAETTLLEHGRVGRLPIHGRPVDDILGERKPAGGIQKIPADRLHRLLLIDLRQNQLEPDIARADLSFGEFEALRTDRGFDLLRVPIAAVRRLKSDGPGPRDAARRNRTKKDFVIEVFAQLWPQGLPEGLSADTRNHEIQKAVKKQFDVSVHERSIRQALSER